MEKRITFLEHVADYLIKNHLSDFGDCTVIFPNRRAGLFLKKHLSQIIDKPVWSPATLSLEDFLFTFSTTKKADPLTLIFELFESFKAHQGQTEGFESFYFWGEMLLRDFEEVDHYLVNPQQLFTYVKDDRQLAEDFYFLDEEQEKIIKKFWQEFLPTATKTQEQFVETWKILMPVYDTFKKRIKEKEIAYTSHVYRELTENPTLIQRDESKPLIFAGFNALTPAEEVLIKHFVTEFNAEILWDIDAYYLEDVNQEAGDFLRRYAKDPIFGTSFPDPIPQKITQPRQVAVTGVSLEVGQAKLIGEEIERLMETGAKKEEIVIVLPQDYMLFPILNAIPERVDKLNVTMGYPLKDTPLFGLLEAAIELQEHASLSPENGLSFYHKPVIDILSHPYLYKEDKNPLDKLISEIKKKNQIRVFQQEIQTIQSTLLNTIFRQIGEQDSLAKYLQDIILSLGEQVVERFGLEREYLYHFQQLLSRLGEILDEQTAIIDIKTFKGLFRKATRSVKIPFTGEPVEGLQVMGVLETRNLDFKHVLMLNMNEDIFPASQRAGSFIPYRIRRAFGLPTFETQDAIFAYLFYRLFHHSEKLFFYYNMFADFGLSGEVSRFIRQIELEIPRINPDFKIVRKKLSNAIQVAEIKPIAIETTQEVLDKLAIYTDTVPEMDQRRLSASALNIYLDCRLKFYFRYVLRLFSGDEMSDDLDARHFGNVLHKTLEYLYLDTMKEKGSRIIDTNDFFRMESSVDGAMEKAFKEEFGLKGKKRFEFKDRNVVMAEIIRKFVKQVIEMDKKYVPFEIISLEAEDKYERLVEITTNDRPIKVKLGADIDRVDRKGETVRVLDYKTGRDETEIGNFENIFNPDVFYKFQAGRKAGYQTFFYAWIYASKHGLENAIVPGLINIKQFFQSDFDYRLKTNGNPIADSRAFLPQFEQKMKELLEEIFNKEEPFNQTEDLRKCAFCDFKGICER
ncbi:PD-(D/E)XK nuclease family protein [Ekhidna sp.]|uniref:PD-(D/E)XK nuclease family protein n=1 Tax=Ekhidna sp. TaxID=2608089 RepID=UPI003BA96E22